MKVETVELHPRPMLYLTRRSGMDPAAIGQAMAEMFAAMGKFIGERNPPVAGPPLAIYRDHAADGVTIDLGFPVAEAGAALQGGEVKAGSTPGGKALKVVHRGPYDQLRATYGELEAHMAMKGILMPSRSWEVYLNEPGAVPDADLLTEIYMPLSD
jgi:effector-binding domain-containing protein